MKKFLIIASLALSLGGCSTFERLKQTAEAVGQYTVSPQTVVIASNTFDALEITATNYLGLKACRKASTVVCRDPTATALIIPAIRSGRVARNNLQQFLADHPNELGPSGAYDALSASISTIQGVFAQYKIGG
jgi:hypothetical protein